MVRLASHADGYAERDATAGTCVTISSCMSRLIQDGTLETPATREPDRIDVLDIILVLTRRRKLIGIMSLAAFLAGTIVSLLLKPDFTATAIIQPPQQQSSAASLMGQLGSLAVLGGGSALGLKTPADMYIGILQSRTIADEIINHSHLQAVYKRTKMQDTRAALKAHTEMESGKDGLIHISVSDHDPNRASELANAYVSELYKLNSTLVITEAAQRRVFFDEQLNGEKSALAAAEDALRATQQRTGLIQLSGQALMIIQTIAQLRAEIASREVQMQSMRTFATEQNPEMARIQEEISTMKNQLAKLENDQRQSQPGNIAVPAGRVPQDSLEYTRKLREVKYHDLLVDLLSRQYEAARIDEAKSAPIIQVIDHAIPPDRKSGPHRSLIVLGFGFAGFAIAVLIAFLQHGYRRYRQIPKHAARLNELRDELSAS
jgi:tyrosine-protein kinase Etk/Wzc